MIYSWTVQQALLADNYTVSLKVSSVSVVYVRHLYEHGANKFRIQIVEACKPYTMTCHWLRLALAAVTYVAYSTVNLPWQCLINADLQTTGTKNSS